MAAELTTIAMSKVTDRLLVWDEDPDSFDDVAAQCRWYRDGPEKVRTETGDSTCGATVCCERWKDVESDPETGQQISTIMVRIGTSSLANPQRNLPSCDSRNDKVFR